jgi:hypothetical protein
MQIDRRIHESGSPRRSDRSNSIVKKKKRNSMNLEMIRIKNAVVERM